ncbi:MAG TPA: Do family serine endopeptidase [Candidatus Eisenbacteria bacterium]|nr:Do family serine endopeptidase [Candidatus Eisenbacteria bacterium]
MIRNPNGAIPPRRYYFGAVALVLAGLVLGLGLSSGLGIQKPSLAQRSTLPSTTSNAAVPESPFVSVVDKALPAVVFIDVRKKVTSRNDSDDPQAELFRRFFGDQQRRPQNVPSSGSGFIVDPSGHILTNNHVVANADDITVTLNDKRTFKAKVVGTDPESDVAVIQIDGQKLPFLQLGDSDRIRVGDWAIAIGNPLGMLRGSVTVGIISAQGRANLNIFGSSDLAFQDFIQTDASINFGNSGGPLCNIRGEVIGINTAINPSGQGIGFAIPINLAKHVADQLMAHGQVQRAWLGVSLDDLTPEIAEGLGIAGQEGVLISQVHHGFPAEKAGLKRNDVIVEYEGDAVTDRTKFRLKVADTPPGKRVSVVVLRDGKRVPVTVTLAERTPEAVAAVAQPPVERTNDTLEGLVVRDLTQEEMNDANVKSGVLVTDVKEGSPADNEGIQSNDIIEEVGGKPAAGVREFARLLRQAKANPRSNTRTAVLLVNRNGATRFVAVPLAN